MKRMISVMILALILTGCASQTATKEEVSKFIADTKEMTALFEDVYNTHREFTTDEERAFNYYKVNYGEDNEFEGNSDVDIRTISTFTQLLYFDAKRQPGVDDTFARDLKEINDRISVVESNDIYK
ncbi:hypothetical protein [Bacillus sp. ISL-7]|uniref:hypothetical protein n=1 Tax=Bacillus sp. ISL-7 TaxID=2819136 RepID=UPI001BECB3C3|nr:hypothetical protein [Bacillus sp. ISL-7]MBT2738121.1 hypothetical protein [Bacillus sp. ISL-7]